MANTTLTEAAKSGDRRAILEALRDKLAASIDACDYGRDVAALARRLMDVCEVLDTLPNDDDDSPLQQAIRKYHRNS